MEVRPGLTSPSSEFSTSTHPEDELTCYPTYDCFTTIATSTRNMSKHGNNSLTLHSQPGHRTFKNSAFSGSPFLQKQTLRIPSQATQIPKPQTTNHKPQTSNFKPQIPHPKPQTPNPKPQTPNPKPQTPSPKPQTPNPKPQTPNPKPQTPGMIALSGTRKPERRFGRKRRERCFARRSSSDHRAATPSLSPSSLKVCPYLSAMNLIRRLFMGLIFRLLALIHQLLVLSVGCWASVDLQCWGNSRVCGRRTPST